MSCRRPSNASSSVTGPRRPISGIAGSNSTIGSRRRAAAIASLSRVCAFSRTRSASSSACQVARSTTGGSAGALLPPAGGNPTFFDSSFMIASVRSVLSGATTGPSGPAHPRSGRWRLHSRALLAVVLVVAAKPGAGFVASLGGSVEPMVDAEERIHAARIGRIGVVDDAVLEREGAHALPLTQICAHIGPGHGRELGGPGRRVSGPPDGHSGVV